MELVTLALRRALPLACPRHEASMLSRSVIAFGLKSGALVVGLIGLAGCGTGGGTAGAATLSCAGGAPNALCLMSCSLGCSSTGCQITDIAQNEIITWNFNKDLDPLSVNDATIQFRTVSGDVPVGDFLVSG